MKLILGNITFEEDNTAIIHSISGIIDCKDVFIYKKTKNEFINELGENLVNDFNSYIIPDLYKGNIIWECDKIIKYEIT